jgi:hypothetical protein
MFGVRTGLNLAAFLILTAGGILVIFLATAPLPFNIIVSVEPGALITAGIHVILLALVPLLTFLSGILKPRTRNEEEKSADLENGLGANDFSFCGEEMIFSQTESMTLQTEDPRIHWNGYDMRSILTSYLGHGEMKFPVPPPALTAALINDPDKAPENSEIVLYRQRETLAYMVAVTSEDGNDLHGFYSKLPPIGHLLFPS